jgi:hypothetical protein
MRFKRPGDKLIVIALFLGVLLVHVSSRNITSTDSIWSIHTAMSVIQEGNTDLDEYQALIAETPNHDYAVEKINGHLYTPYPIGASLVAVPFVWAIDRLSTFVSPVRFADYIQHARPEETELFLASLIVTLTTVVIYGMARLFLDKKRALILVLVFAFCTSAWSTASRALWQHGPSMLMLALALYLILLAKKRPFLSQFVALPLACAYVIRPTNSLSVLVLTLYVFLHYRRYFVRYVLWALLLAVPFIAFNVSIYHTLLSDYYRSYRDFAVSGAFFENFAGLLVSPSRGLLLYSPVFLFALWGVGLNLKRNEFYRLDLYLCAIVLLHLAVLAVWRLWWGGWSYGPRMLTDLLPFLMYWLIPVVAALFGTDQSQDATTPLPARAKTGLKLAFIVLAGFSFIVHARGATITETFDWNRYPANVDTYPQRLWDWRDIQFLRGIPWGTPADLSVAGLSPTRFDPSVDIRLGTNTLRVRHFDAGGALIAPRTPGWLALNTAQAVSPALAPLLIDMTPTLAGQTQEEQQDFQLYSFNLGERIWAAAQNAERGATWSPTLYPDEQSAHAITLPVQFGANAELLGFQITPEHNQLTVLTYWRAGQPNADRLQLFVHALDATGQIIAQEDRLDAPSEDWQPGDLIAQVNHLAIPAHAGPVWIQTGLYATESGQRLPVMVDGQAVDQRVLLKHLDLP